MILQLKKLIGLLMGVMMVNIDEIKILGKNILIRKPEYKDDMEKSKGGIFLPQTAKIKPTSLINVRVLNAGVECEHVHTDDEIYINRNSIMTFDINGIEYHYVHEDNVVGVLSL